MVGAVGNGAVETFPWASVVVYSNCQKTAGTLARVHLVRTPGVPELRRARGRFDETSVENPAGTVGTLVWIGRASCQDRGAEDHRDAAGEPPHWTRVLRVHFGSNADAARFV